MLNPALLIADDLLQLSSDSPILDSQDPEPYQGLGEAWFRVTGPDGGTYYVTVSRSIPNSRTEKAV